MEPRGLVLEAGADPPAPQQQLPSTGEEGDDGSCELSDEVSRDSTMGSDSDTFSSPFCLSPVSEALCESSGSVFLDNDSRSVRVYLIIPWSGCILFSDWLPAVPHNRVMHT